jgi:quercetin dioxygenase-like cupin family protein
MVRIWDLVRPLVTWSRAERERRLFHVCVQVQARLLARYPDYHTTEVYVIPPAVAAEVQTMLTTLVPRTDALARREQILAFEATLRQHPRAVHGDSEQFPLTHYFAPGMYLRAIQIPAGSLLVGKIHKQAHLVVLLQGALRLYTEAGGLQEVRAPQVLQSPAGAKRAALALEDTVWVTCHANPSDTQDLAALEAEIIAPSFAAYAAWRTALDAGEPWPERKGDDGCHFLPRP